MLEARERARPVRAFRGYLLGIARNMLHEHRRMLARTQDVDRDLEFRAQPGPGPSEVLGAHQERRLLVESLHHLSTDDRSLIELFYWEGLDSHTLGKIFHMPASTVRTRLARSRERIRIIMATANGQIIVR